MIMDREIYPKDFDEIKIFIMHAPSNVFSN